MGKRNRPFYRIVAIDSRTSRDGRAIEYLGHYDPLKKKGNATVVDRERVIHWLDQGAQPSESVAKLLRKQGIYTGK
jgi:small subunit ribosomal protein S16